MKRESGRDPQQLATKAESGRGKRISLAPLPFEKALGAFMQVPPPSADEPTPKMPRKKKRPAQKAGRRAKK
jgi:hypothetical protein